MRGHPHNLDSFVVGLAVGRCSREGGQEGGVNVQNSVFPVPNKIRGENLHKASQHDEVDFSFF